MSLLPPINTPITQYFAPPPPGIPSYPYYHVGNETARFVPYSGASRTDFHAGLDRSAAIGSALQAIETGIVIRSGWAVAGSDFDGGGLMLDVKIAGGMHYAFNHCNRLLVVPGQKVTRGQHIADLGSTGNITGPVVHEALFTLDALGNLFYNPLEFEAGGIHQDSSLIIAGRAPIVTHSPYPAQRRALIAAHATVNAYSPNKPNAVALQYTNPLARATGIGIDGLTTVRWSDGSHTVPIGTFLQVSGRNTGGGPFLHDLLLLKGQVKAADGKPW